MTSSLLLVQTCLVIYMFGDNRQLYPWEIAAVKAETDSISAGSDTSDPWGFSSSPSPASSTAAVATTTTNATQRSSVDEKAGSTLDSADSADVQTAPSGSPSHSAFFDLGYIPRGTRPSSASASGSEGSHARSGRSATTPGGLYFAPAAMDLPPSSRVWEAFTKQLSPVVARAQRNLVATAALYGLVIMAITAAICLSVPNRK